MTERLDALERLQALLDSGAIDADEFAAEKARLFQSDAPATPPAAPAYAAPPYMPDIPAPPPDPHRGLRAGAIAFGVVLALGIGGLFLMQRSEGTATATPDAPPAAAASAAAPASDTPAPPTGIKAASQPDQLRAAFRAAFGTDRRAVRQINEESVRFENGRLIWAGDDRAILVTPGTIPDGCHGCSGTLAIHYLRPEGAGFAVVGEWLDRAGGSSWGSPATSWSISDRFSRYPAVYAEGGGTWQGYTCSSARITILTPSEPIASDMVAIYADNGTEPGGKDMAGNPARNVEGEIVNIVPDTSFDVRFTGTESFTESYRYTNGRYVLTSGETRAGC